MRINRVVERHKGNFLTHLPASCLCSFQYPTYTNTDCFDVALQFGHPRAGLSHDGAEANTTKIIPNNPRISLILDVLLCNWFEHIPRVYGNPQAALRLSPFIQASIRYRACPEKACDMCV